MANIWICPILLMSVASARRFTSQDIESDWALDVNSHQGFFNAIGKLFAGSGSSSVGSDEIAGGVDMLTNTLEFAKNPTVSAAGSAMVAVGTAVSMFPMPPVTQIIGGILGATGAVMSLFGPGDEEPEKETEKAKRATTAAALEGINKQVGELTKEVKRAQQNIEEVLTLTRGTYENVVLGKGKLEEVERRYARVSMYMHSAMQDPRVKKGACKKAEKANDELGSESFEQGALHPNKLKQNLQYIMHIKGKVEGDADEKEGGITAAAQAYKTFMVTRFKLFWLVWTGTICEDGMVSINSKKHMERLEQQINQYKVVAEDVLGAEGLKVLKMNTEETIAYQKSKFYKKKWQKGFAFAKSLSKRSKSNQADSLRRAKSLGGSR